jgi:25S rRNA (uracil2843-N3)-methyltransferase
VCLKHRTCTAACTPSKSSYSANSPHRSRAPLPNRIRPIAAYLPAPKIIELAPTQSAPIRPITTPERDLLTLLAKLSHPILSSTSLNTTLQAVKSALYEKDYEKAFGSSEEYREAYAARWVPSRALVYRKICFQSKEIKAALLNSQPGETKEVICLGGGAGSEVVALGSLLSRVGEGWEGIGGVRVNVVDNCGWEKIVEKQQQGMVGLWKEMEGRFDVGFTNADVLDIDSPIDYSKATLVTLLFTISELFLQSRTKTMALLAHLSSNTPSGALLLIIESASLSEIPIGSSGRTYPLGTLLDHALASDKSGNKGGKGAWEVVRAEESVWYRMPEGAKECYPLKLENTRVVIRLYRKL